MHAGTHIDAPAHMLAGGASIQDIPASTFIGRGRLIDARGVAIAGPELLEGAEIDPGDIVLVLTGFSDRFGQPAYYRDYPEISEAFAEALIRRGVRLLGLDTPSPDRPPFRVHKLLLANGVLIIENLTNLAALLGAAHFEIAALPLKLDAGAAPARVMAVTRTQGEARGADS
jgi:kynurenine formamidase